MSDDFSEPNEPTDEELKAMNDTDDQLKQLLAKMLPETVEYYGSGKLLYLKPVGTTGACFKSGVLDTELLHLCSFVESGLTDDEHARFRATLVRKITERADMTSMMNKAEYRAWFSATWQQRVAALAEVKGVTL